MTYKNLLTETTGDHMAVVTLNRPQHLNTFDSAMARELDSALREYEAHADVRVVIIKGSGKAFCAGIDLKELAGQTPLEYRQWVETMERPFLTIATMTKPVIAQVHGVAAANGMGLVAAADLAIAAEDARMGLTAINVGLNCVGPVLPVARSVGRKRALELLLCGELIPASEALSWGLINKVVPAEDLEAATQHWANEIAAKSPLGVQTAKSAFYYSEDAGYAEHFAYMNEVFARLCTTDDAAEGVRAFFEKRDPIWTET
jgi:enoyl-CoA hydratase/carnithine racemase